MVSIIGPELAKECEDRLEPVYTTIHAVTGGKAQTLGVLRLVLEVDGIAGELAFRAAPRLEQQMILGMDFAGNLGLNASSGKARGAPAAESGESSVMRGTMSPEWYTRNVPEFRSWMTLSDNAIVPVRTSELLGYTTLIKHHIDVKGVQPIKVPPRRQSPKMVGETQKAVEKMLRQGVIEPSISREHCTTYQTRCHGA